MAKKLRTYGKVIPVNPVWIGKEDAMRLLACSESYLKRLRLSGKINYAQDGRMTWYEVLSINRYINSLRVI